MAMGVINRIRQPEYTGQNRCMACTAVNAGLAALLSMGCAAATARLHSAAAGAVAGVAVAATSVVSIWLRGYLVPGTPELTKRHMPRWMLAWFGKAREPRHGEGPVVEDGQESVDAEAILLEHGIAEPCRGGEEYCLTSSFVGDWEAARADRDAAVDVSTLAPALGVDPEGDAEIDVERADEAVKFTYDGSRLALWPSTAAARADVVTARVLSDWIPEWGEHVPYQRAMLFKSIRILLDRCPNGDETELREDVVESCCSTHDVYTVVCTGSDERLVEQAAD